MESKKSILQSETMTSMEARTCNGKNVASDTHQGHEVKRVGNLTLGITLVIMGGLFLVHMIWPSLHYEYVLRMWPCVFISLGIEILLANRKDDTKFVCEKGSIVLIFLLIFFAMCLAFADAVFFEYFHCISA